MPSQIRPHADEDATIQSRWNPVTSRVIGFAIEVHSRLGPGLPEKLYEEALCYELSKAAIAFRRQALVRVNYKELILPELKIDILVEDGLIIELKAVDKVSDVHIAQLVSYLRAARLPIGLLLNFNVMRLTDGIYRRINSNIPPATASSSPAPSAFSAPSAPSAFKTA